MGTQPFHKHSKYQVNPERKLRKCLCCEKKFMSEWIGNRMCEPCKQGSRTQIETFEARRGRA
jgi:hypothetical protein